MCPLCRTMPLDEEHVAEWHPDLMMREREALLELIPA